MNKNKLLEHNYKTNLPCPVCGQHLHTCKTPEHTFSCECCKNNFDPGDIKNVNEQILRVYIPATLKEYTRSFSDLIKLKEKVKLDYISLAYLPKYISAEWKIYVLNDQVYLPSKEIIQSMIKGVNELLHPNYIAAGLEAMQHTKLQVLGLHVCLCLKDEPEKFKSVEQLEVYNALHELYDALVNYDILEQEEQYQKCEVRSIEDIMEN